MKRVGTSVESAWFQQRLQLEYDHLFSSFAFNSHFAPLHPGGVGIESLNVDMDAHDDNTGYSKMGKAEEAEVVEVVEAEEESDDSSDDTDHNESVTGGGGAVAGAGAGAGVAARGGVGGL